MPPTALATEAHYDTWLSRLDPEPDAKHISTNASGSLKNLETSLLNYPDYIFFDIDSYVYSGKEEKGAEPEYHPEGDVWTHTLLMLEGLENPSITMALAVLLHDVAKPPTFRIAERIRHRHRREFAGCCGGARQRRPAGARLTRAVRGR